MAQRFNQMKKTYQILLPVATLLLASCSIHKIDIQQGSILTPEIMQRISIGMDRQQVRFTLGSPPITDPFHPDRWDYYYSLKSHGKPLERKHFALFFDDKGKISRIEPAPEPSEE